VKRACGNSPTFDKLLKVWDVTGDGKITEDEMRERNGPADAFVQVDLYGDGVFTREEHALLAQIGSALT